MLIPRPARIALALVLSLALAPLASCGGGSSATKGPKLTTWPLDTVAAEHRPVSAMQGGKVSVTTSAMTAEIEFPPGALSEDMDIEILPFTGPPVKDGTENLADGCFIRRVDDGVNAPPALAKPATLRITVAKPAPAGSTILKWSLANATAEPVKTTVQAQGGSSVLTAEISAMGGYGARAPKGEAQK